MDDNVTQLYFYPEDNAFTDGGGYTIYNIYSYITPSILFLFKMKKEYMLVACALGGVVELFYPEDEDAEN